ncbi:Uncharacterised protein [Plesiomonas shigelloides]|uniref:hypothetical protein n=1 Tax=Plesiomonas shigelloides TaxID=703 RepID=UPI000DF8AAA6|nr:hypothetical protein [Plesiomonas shigelloides]SUB63517.1 Uncharacterised protein [Plesiomonas shigelloides]
MKESNWAICFNGYMRKCSSRSIFFSSFRSLPTKYTVLLSVLSSLFAILFAASVCSMRYYTGYFPTVIYLTLMLVAEISVMLLVYYAQNKYMKSYYDEIQLGVLPPEDTFSQKARYVKFRLVLRENKITREQATKFLKVLDARIEMCNSYQISGKKIVSFSIAIFMVALAVLVKSISLKLLVQLLIIFISTVSILYMVSTVFPSLKEKLYEMKYFILMYINE